MTVINIIEVRKTNSGGVADVDSIQSFSIYDEQESGEVYAEAMKCFKDTVLKQFPAMEETHSDEDFEDLFEQKKFSDGHYYVCSVNLSYID